MAFAHVHDLVGSFGIKPDQDAATGFQCPQSRTPAALRRRQMRVADRRLEPMLRKRAGDPIDQVASVGSICDVLELAATAFGKAAARRRLVAGSRNAVPEQSRCRG